MPNFTKLRSKRGWNAFLQWTGRKSKKKKPNLVPSFSSNFTNSRLTHSDPQKHTTHTHTHTTRDAHKHKQTCKDPWQQIMINTLRPTKTPWPMATNRTQETRTKQLPASDMVKLKNVMTEKNSFSRSFIYFGVDVVAVDLICQISREWRLSLCFIVLRPEFPFISIGGSTILCM